MPVKNKNRQSNSGYEGVITGLNDEEKKVLEDAGIGGDKKYISITTTLNDLQNAVNSFSTIVYNESDKAEIISFIKNQKGIIKLTVATPVGNLYMTLRPSLWKDDTNHSYNFEGSLCIETDLSAIGGSVFNQIIVRAICWDYTDPVHFRPTIIPIFDAIGDINSILDNINGEVI